MEYKFVKFEDESRMVINIVDISYYLIKGDKTYDTILMLLSNGKYVELKYSKTRKESFNRDVEYLNSLVVPR